MMQDVRVLADRELDHVAGGEPDVCRLSGFAIRIPPKDNTVVGGILTIINTDCGNGWVAPAATFIPDK